MQVYGDHSRRADAGDELAAVLNGWDTLRHEQSGLAWHGRCVALLIRLGGLLQGVADRDFARAGCDQPSDRQDALMAGLLTVAGAVRRSWDSGFGEQSCGRLRGLVGLDLSGEIEVRRPEGYAFYALYPEAYRAAAQDLEPGAVVIGLRSIGTALAAVVADAAQASEVLTLRPVGEPFARTVRVDSALSAKVSALADRPFVIVDEGPGLSGSSFGGVADWLELLGVARHRIAFMPSHPGDLGPQASPAHRQRWQGALKPFASFEQVVVAPDDRRSLPWWFEDLTGPAIAPLQDMSGGAWASGTAISVDPGREARKFLLVTRQGVFRLKFVGLDLAAEAKFARARRLHEAGFAVRPLALRHGFLLEDHVEAPIAAQVPVERLAEYLSFRACHFPAARAGAPLGVLAAMATNNLAEADPLLDLRSAASWARRCAADLQALCRPVEVDARLHRWEWLDLGDRLVKTDALDHAEAHDLVGCQDIAWDLAGAIIEHELDASDAAWLAEQVMGGRPRRDELLRLMTYAYLGFQVGWWSFSQAPSGGERSAWYAQRAARFVEATRWAG